MASKKLSCKDSKYAPGSGLEFITWTTPESSLSAQSIQCIVADGERLVHHVAVKNWKKYKLQIRISAEFVGDPNRACFVEDGFPKSSDYCIESARWTGTKPLTSDQGDDRVDFNRVLIAKQLPGDDGVRIKVQYSYRWNPKEFREATEDVGPLKINIELR